MLMDALLEATRRRPGAAAVSDPTRKMSYRRLTAASLVLRDIIGRRTHRDRVGILLPACGGFSAVLFGTFWSRKIAVPLNFLLSPQELRKIVGDAGIDLVVSIHPFDDLLKELPCAAVALEDLRLKRRTLLAMLRRRPDPPQVSGDDTAVILYTSGTDGDPKGVMLTYRNLQSNCDDCIATARMTSEHRLLNVLPPFHVFGLTANVLVPVVLGASVHCLPRFQPAAVIEAVRQEKASIFMAVPSMYAALLRSHSVPPDTFTGLYLAVSGGEPLPATVADGFRQRFGVELMEGYGLTETSPVLTLNVPHAYKPGTVGRPIRNVEIRIADDRGRDVPTDVDGEIWARGPGIMKGYHNRPDATAAVMEPGGWFKTGDVGRLDGDGFVRITGRKKEMIIVGGENVFPREIESVLHEHPAVAEAAVIGMPDASRGEVPVAFVICREGATVTEPELRAFARQCLAGHKVPRAVHIARDLPRGPTGKIRKHLLRQQLQP